jgi:hypothetical protein
MSMSYAMLPADRVKDAAEKALLAFDPKEHGFDETHDNEKRIWFNGLIGLCRAVMADPKADHDVEVEATDFTWIMKHYDFTDPRLIIQHEHPSTARVFGKGAA